LSAAATAALRAHALAARLPSIALVLDLSPLTHSLKRAATAAAPRLASSGGSLSAESSAGTARPLGAAELTASALTATASELIGSASREVLPSLFRSSAKLLARLGRLLIAAAVIPLLRGVVAVLDALTMLGVVLPVLAVALYLGTTLLDVGVVHVPCVVVVPVDIDIHVTAAPVAIPPERASHRYVGRE